MTTLTSPTPDPQVELAELADEFLARYRRGENPRISDFATRRPDLAAEVRRLFPALVVMERCEATVDATGPRVSAPTPDRVGEYRIVGPLGEGGMGVVYEAVQEPLGRPVAIKFLQSVGGGGAIQRERFLRETQAAARLAHPHIVTVYGTGEHRGVPYYAMQLIRGRGLEKRIEEAAGAAARPATAAQCHWAVGIAVQVADALAYAHGMGVVHRDIKPSNLLLDMADRVWVADFGLARIEGQDHLTEVDGFVGTRLYMAPEQYAGWADPRTDLYALGVTLYELLTHVPAFQASTPEAVVRRVIDADLVPPRRHNPAIPRDLETIVLKAIAAEPGHRYASAAAFADDLRRFLDGRPIAARRTTTVGRAWRWAKRNRLAAGSLVALAVVMAATTVGSVWAAVRFDGLRDDADRHRNVAERGRTTIARQLEEVERAKRREKELSSQILLRTAQANVAGQRPGGRSQALAALREAAGLARELGVSPANLAALRDEYVKALAGIDIGPRPGQTWELPSADVQLAYAADGKRYAVVDRAGVVSVRDTATNKETHRLTSAGSTIIHLRFSPDGEFFAGYQDGKLHVWEPARGAKPIRTFAQVAGRAFDFHPHDAAIAFADLGRTIHLCPLRTTDRQTVGRLPVDVSAIRFDPTGDRIGAYKSRDPMVHVLEVADGPPTRYPLPAGARSLAWSADGSRLAVGGNDGSVYLCRRDAPTDKPAVLAGHTGPVVSMAFHPRDELLVSGAWDQTVRVWDPVRLVPATRELYSASYQALEFTKDGRSLGLGQDGSRVWVWEVQLPTLGQTVVRGEGLWGSAESPDGRWLVGAGDPGLTLYDLAGGGRPVRKVPGQCRRAWFAADGRSLTTGGAAGATRYDFGPDGPSLEPADRWEVVRGIDHWWSDDRSLLAVPTQRQAAVYSPGAPQPRYTVHHTNMLEYMAFSRDNRWLAGGAWKEPNVRVWDGATGRPVALLETPPTARPTFAPDGRLVIGTGAAYQFYAADTWRPGLRLAREDCGQTPGTAAFSPDGALFAGWGRRGVVVLWDAHTGHPLVSLPITARTGSLDTHGELKFSSDGRRLSVVADHRHIQLWDLAALRAQLATAGLDW